MGLFVHMPRAVASIGKGLWKRRQRNIQAAGTTAGRVDNDGLGLGLGLDKNNRHIYQARAGVWDYALGHLNNAAFLTHAELARWQMIAEMGMVDKLWHDKILFLVASSSIRYRREIAPLWRNFQVESSIVSLDSKSKQMYFYQTFRYDDDNGSGSGENSHHPQQERIRAQVMTQTVLRCPKQGIILDPRAFLKDITNISNRMNMNSDPQTQTHHDWIDGISDGTSLQDMMDQHEKLQGTFQKAAAEDDNKLV
jgi:acyl-CoA thioesterase FadM